MTEELDPYTVEYVEGSIDWNEDAGPVPKGLPKRIVLKVVIVDGEVDDVIDEDLI